MYSAPYWECLKNQEFMLLLVKIRFYVFYKLEELANWKEKRGKGGQKNYLQRAANSIKE